MFAFAVWDSVSGRLFLARDRLGVKPLYYLERPDGIAFSSEVRTLLDTQLADRKLSPESVASYLLFGSVREPATILSDVKSLPPGSVLVRDRGETTLRRYWSLPLREAQFLDREDAVSRLRELLLNSVRMRLVADVPVGVFLSGGVDSAAVVALASIASSAPVHTFTVTFDADVHEGGHASEFAHRNGCVHREAMLRSCDIPRDMELALAALDQPSADGMNTYFVSRAARQAGLVVALSGLGGDELFAGYANFPRFRWARPLAAFRWPRLARWSSSRLAAHAALPTQLRKAVALLDTDGTAQEAYAVMRSFFVPSQIGQLARVGLPLLTNGYAGLNGLVDRAVARGDIDGVNAYGALEITNYLSHTLLRDTDAMSMAHSLEVREPLLDSELVEFAMSTPGDFKFDGPGNKPLLADAVPEVSPAVRMRKKRGFELPFDAWLRGPLRAWAKERLLGATSARPDLLQRPAVEALWGKFESGAPGVPWSRIWCLAVLADWCDRHRVRG
jgi:asparagine synthase (glutamine-hydrolysing)